MHRRGTRREGARGRVRGRHDLLLGHRSSAFGLRTGGRAGPSASRRGRRPVLGQSAQARRLGLPVTSRAPAPRTAATAAISGTDDDVAPESHQENAGEDRNGDRRVAPVEPARPRRSVRPLLRVVAGAPRRRGRRSQAMPLRPIPPGGGGRCQRDRGHDARARPLQVLRPAGHPVHLRLGAHRCAARIGGAGGDPVERGNDPVHARRLSVTPGTVGVRFGRARSEESMEFHVLGPLEIVRQGRTLELGAGKQRALLAVLLLHANEVVSTDRLIDALWGEQAPATAPKIVQGYVSRLRKVARRARAAGPVGRRERRHPADPVARVRPPDRGRTARRGPLRGAARAGRGRRSPAARRSRHRRSSARRWISGAARRSPTSASTRSRRRRSPASRSSTWPPSRNGSRPTSRSDAPPRGRRRARGPRRPSSAARAAARAADARALPLRPAGRGAARLPGHAARAGRRARPRAEPGDRGARAGDPPSGPRRSTSSRSPRHRSLRPRAEAGSVRGRRADGVFVGRERELAALVAALGDALSGSGRLVVVGGEPGIGKSRLAEELASRAASDGAEIHWGRCWEEGGAPPYWPWVQVLRACVRERGAEQLTDELGAGAAEVAELVPDVRQRLPELQMPSGSADPQQARFRLFDAVAGFLTRASRSRPLVIVLDDLNWADKGSLLLLEFVARELAETNVVLVGTYRDIDLSRGHPLRQTLAELSRERLFERVLLRGLAHEDVARFIEAACGFEPDMALVEAIHAQTEGNPFFVGEVVRLLREEGALTPEASRTPERWSARIPDGVREAVGRRLERLSPPCSATLTVASAIGREFGLDQLELLVDDLDEEALLEALDEALAAHVVEELPGYRRSVPVHARPDPGDARGRALADAARAAPRPHRGGSGGAVRRRGRRPRRRARSPLRRGPVRARYRQARSLLRARGGVRARGARSRSRRSSTSSGRSRRWGTPRPTIRPPSCCSASAARSWRRSGTTELGPAVASLRRSFEHYVEAGDIRRAVAVACPSAPAVASVRVHRRGRADRARTHARGARLARGRPAARPAGLVLRVHRGRLRPGAATSSGRPSRSPSARATRPSSGGRSRMRPSSTRSISAGTTASRGGCERSTWPARTATRAPRSPPAERSSSH